MTAIRRTLMRALFLAIGLLVLLGQVGQAADEQELGARYVKRLRKRVERLVLHPRSIGGRDGLLAYMETEHVPLEDICMLLQIFIEEAGEDLPPSDDEAEREELLDRRRWLATNAILRLPEMGCHGARPLLKEVALGEGKGELAEKLRDVAVGAVVELGGDDLVEFARAVYEDRQHFGGQDRFELYRDLALYVGVQAHVTVPYLLPKSERDRQAPRSDIFRFFRYALVHDEYISSGMLLDEVLHAASTLYAHSDERQEVLEKLKADEFALVKDYAAEELTALEKVPAEQRTRLPVNIEDPAALRALGQAVAQSPEGYTALDRRLVYEALVALGAKQNGALLLRAAMREPDVGNVLYLDKALQSANADYLFSYEREAVLSRFDNKLTPEQTEFIDGTLEMLRGDSGLRTHLRMPEGTAQGE